MAWHICAIVCGVLIAIPASAPAPYVDIVMGVLVVIFASLALRAFRKARKA